MYALRGLLLAAAGLLGGCFFKFDMVTHEAPVDPTVGSQTSRTHATEPAQAPPVLRFTGSQERLEQIARGMRASPSGRDWEICQSSDVQSSLLGLSGIESP